MKEIEELIRPKFSIRSRFQTSKDLEVTNLDWGATSHPLVSVEDAVKNNWRDYGNPHSCGTITSKTSADIIERTKARVMECMDFDSVRHPPSYEVEFGGEGATHWLEKIPRLFSRETHSPICIQRELHNSLIEPWVEGGFDLVLPPRNLPLLEWFERRLRYIREIEKKTPVVLLSLSSHVTGRILNVELLKDLIDEEDVVVLDATCYITHEKRFPKLRFDLAVFSGHKLPGGPGSPGVVICSNIYSNRLFPRRGSRNVVGISRLGECLVLRKKILSVYPSDLVHELNSLFYDRGESSLLPLTWDPEEIYKNSHPIFSFILRYRERHVHPDIIADIMLNVFGFQIRIGGQCSEFTIPADTVPEWAELPPLQDPLFKPSVCRISIPAYLLSRELVDRIDNCLRSLATFGHLLVPCYTLKNRFWKEDPSIGLYMGSELEKREDSGRNVSCGSCSGLTNYISNGSRGNVRFDTSDIINSMIMFRPRIEPSERSILHHPYRWFLLPDDDVDDLV